MEKLKKEIISLLFVMGEPVPISKLAKLTGGKESKIKETVSLLKEEMKNYGLSLLEKDSRLLLASSAEMAGILGALRKEELEGELSRASVEVLSIIIYRNPSSRADIDYIRGVNSGFVLRNLTMRGLVERVPNPKDARMYLYKPSFELMRFLGVEDLSNLPEYGRMSQSLKDFLNEK